MPWCRLWKKPSSSTRLPVSARLIFRSKGNNPLTEHYSAIGPEVLDGPNGERIAEQNRTFIQQLEKFDALFIAGQAKSHCVAWTINDLLNDILVHDERLVEKIYLLEDCTSPVVVPGVVDYTEQADAAFRKFAQAGMHVVRSTEPIQVLAALAKFIL